MNEPTVECMCVYAIEFADGGDMEGQVLHVGTAEECRKVSLSLHAVSYGGSRPAVAAYMFVLPKQEGTKPGDLITMPSRGRNGGKPQVPGT